MGHKLKSFKVIYEFSQTSDWKQRLDSVYELIFRKIEDMEIKKYENKKHI